MNAPHNPQKCDGCEPCSFCVSRGDACVYQERRQAKGPRTLLKTKFATLQRRYHTLLRDVASGEGMSFVQETVQQYLTSCGCCLAETNRSSALSVVGSSTIVTQDKYADIILSDDFQDKLWVLSLVDYKYAEPSRCKGCVGYALAGTFSVAAVSTSKATSPTS